MSGDHAAHLCSEPEKNIFDRYLSKGENLGETLLHPHKESLEKIESFTHEIRNICQLKAQHKANAGKQIEKIAKDAGLNQLQSQLIELKEQFSEIATDPEVPKARKVQEFQKIQSVLEQEQDIRNQIVHPAMDRIKTRNKELEFKALSFIHSKQYLVRHVMGAVLAELASKTDEQEAKTWAQAQYVSPAAKAHLEKIRYSEVELRQDLAECQRLLHGRIDVINIDYTGSNRASTLLSTRTIYLDNQFNKYTLFHEVGHMAELYLPARFASQHFIRNRQDQGGRFYDDYISTIYDDGCTEVVSMGVQQLSSPERLYTLYEEDREMFYYILGLFA